MDEEAINERNPAWQAHRDDEDTLPEVAWTPAELRLWQRMVTARPHLSCLEDVTRPARPDTDDLWVDIGGEG